jgi:hypothetical protein
MPFGLTQGDDPHRLLLDAMTATRIRRRVIWKNAANQMRTGTKD